VDDEFRSLKSICVCNDAKVTAHLQFLSFFCAFRIKL